MNFIEYQDEAVRTAVYPDSNKIVYPALGLGNEAGEVLGKIKKCIRDNSSNFESRKEIIADEIGDVLWYIAALCRDLDLSMNDVAVNNIKKLRDRQERNVLQGDGDKR